MARRLALLLLLAGCSPDRVEPLARVEQATTEDGLADAVFGQPSLTSGTEPISTSSITTHFPVGLATNAVASPTDTNPLLMIADQGANRVLGLYSLEIGARHLAGQTSYAARLPNAGFGVISASGLDSPAAVALSYEQVAIADTGNHRVLLGYRGSTPWSPFQVYGQHSRYDSGNRNDGGAIGPETLAEPSGVAFDAVEAPGRLIIADTGNHRVLLFGGAFDSLPTTAQRCIGQDDCTHGEPNRGGAVSRNGLREPRGIATYNVLGDPLRGFYVADTGNHRVLHFTVFSATPDLVFGQGGDFTTAIPSKGGPSASSLKSPTGVAVDVDGSVYIADTGHHRVLHFPKGITVADRVLGQPNFTTADAPTTASATRMRAPTSVALTGTELFVADSGFSRVLRFKRPCDATKCNDGNPCTDDICDIWGGCRNLIQTYSKACSPYRCDTVSKTCSRPCDATHPCRSPFQCVNGTCALPCVVDAGCVSLGRTCVDGFCCDRACNGPCERCNELGNEGTCEPMPEGPPAAPRTCDGVTGECGARCNGYDGTRCEIAREGAACGTEACSADVVSLRGTCDGKGACSAKTADCFPFGCDINACRTSCRFDFDCASGARCAGGVCVSGVGGAAAGGGCSYDRRASGVAAFIVAAALAVSIRRRRR